MGPISILGNAHLVTEHKANLDDTGHTCSHEGVSKSLVGHGTDHQFLRVGGHGPAGNEDDKARNKVALRRAVPPTAEPNAGQAGAPPNNAHGGVLPVVLDPGGAPSVLGEGVDAAPGGNDDAVEELLGATGATQPQLADQQGQGHEDTVGDESAAHDEVGQALAEVVALAETLGGDATEQQLDPGDDGENLAADAVYAANPGANTGVETPLKMQLEVNADGDLADHVEKNPIAKVGVDVVGAELAAFVHVAEGVAEEGDDGG